jgi:hypothetical protein
MVEEEFIKMTNKYFIQDREKELKSLRRTGISMLILTFCFMIAYFFVKDNLKLQMITLCLIVFYSVFSMLNATEFNIKKRLFKIEKEIYKNDY